MAIGRITSSALLVVGALAALTIAPVPSAEAAQPYHCICNGKDKRFLASTRYCEHQHNVKNCTREQWRQTYGRACREYGCRLAPLH